MSNFDCDISTKLSESQFDYALNLLMERIDKLPNSGVPLIFTYTPSNKYIQSMCSILNLDIVPCVYLLSKAYEKLTFTPDTIQFSNFRSDDFYIKYHTFINYLYHIIHKYAEYCPEILDIADLRNSRDIIKILSIAKFKSLGLEIEHTADSIAID